jgi:hypothetical protein
MLAPSPQNLSLLKSLYEKLNTCFHVPSNIPRGKFLNDLLFLKQDLYLGFNFGKGRSSIGPVIKSKKQGAKNLTQVRTIKK